MRAVRVTRFGPPSVLVAGSVATPSVGPEQVLVRVAAAGVNFIDTLIRADDGPTSSPRPPFVPGNEVGGTVVEVGPDVSPALVGQTVVAGLGGFGGYAELAVAPAGLVVPVPAGLGVREAVAVMTSGRTAVELLRRVRLVAGERVLVLAAAGGLGSLVVQLALAAGAGVVVGAAGGARKGELVSSLGASAVDYSMPDWIESVFDATGGLGIDVVFDGVGGAIGRAAFELLAEGSGRQVVYGYASGSPVQIEAAELAGHGLSLLSVGGPQLREPAYVRELVGEALAATAAGRLRPTIGQTFPLEDAAAAHATIEARRAVGKTLLIP
ncbi:MDR/zinc-dependent alcohol dehydrogenase-like family protein [Flindersiella endophytica]